MNLETYPPPSCFPYQIVNVGSHHLIPFTSSSNSSNPQQNYRKKQNDINTPHSPHHSSVITVLILNINPLPPLLVPLHHPMPQNHLRTLPQLIPRLLQIRILGARLPLPADLFHLLHHEIGGPMSRAKDTQGGEEAEDREGHLFTFVFLGSFFFW